MPVFTSASLVSSALSALLHSAGKVVDALNGAKSDTVKKSGPLDKTMDAAAFANLVAAYLAAVAARPPTAPSTLPTAPAATPTPTPTSTNNPIRVSPNSVISSAPSTPPLSLMLATGPTTALAAAAALRSVTGKGTVPATKGHASSAVVHTAALPNAPTAKMVSATAALAHTASAAAGASAVHSAPPAAALAHTTATTSTSAAHAAPPAAALAHTAAAVHSAPPAAALAHTAASANASAAKGAPPAAALVHTVAAVSVPAVTTALPPAALVPTTTAPANPSVVKAQTTTAILNLAATKQVQAKAVPVGHAIAAANGTVVKEPTAPFAAAIGVTNSKIVQSNASAVAHPAAAKPSPTVANPPRPPGGRPEAVVVKAPTAEKGKPTQGQQPASPHEQSAASGTVSPMQAQTTATPVLALLEVPTPIVQASPEHAAVIFAPPERAAAPRVQVAAAEEKPSAHPETAPVPKDPSILSVAQANSSRSQTSPRSQTLFGNAVRETLFRGRADDGSRQTQFRKDGSQTEFANQKDAQPQTLSFISAVSQTGLPAPVVHAAGQSLSATPAAPNAEQTNMPVAEQLSHALVSQANLVNRDGRTDFHLRLDPPQLGGVQIHLTAAEHTISARVVVSQEGTQQLIAGQAHHLRQSLADAGLVLSKFDVTHQGGGSLDNGHRPPPELPPPPVVRIAAPASAAVVKTNRIVPAHGIDILA